MPLNKSIKKVMVIGSGPIVIGQAAEFDYAGTQACKALKEQGINVVLVNSNPATLMTDHSMADAIYIEPLIPETIQRTRVSCSSSVRWASMYRQFSSGKSHCRFRV